jgi:tRNA A-37 threonylcarbamoyl transferase component Bud32
MAVTAEVLGNRYELGRLIGAGGMADVYEGFDRLLGRQVAVKIPHPQLARDPAFLVRFRREASMAASLAHPGVVAVYDSGQDDGISYMVMEYVEGATLSEVLRAEGAFAPSRAADLAIAVCAALGAAHAKGLIHRDIKPSNVMLARDGRVKVMDFGVARTLTASVTLTGSVGIVGTAKYMSPEQARGASVDGRSDLYSLGVCLYECLSGRPPFEGDSPVAIATRHVYAAPPPLRSLRPDLPPAYETVTARAMAKDPANRYQTSAELAEDLRRAQAGRPVTAPRLAEPVAPRTGPGPTASELVLADAAVPGRRARTPSRTTGLLRWPVVLGLAVLAGVGLFLAGWPPSSRPEAQDQQGGLPGQAGEAPGSGFGSTPGSTTDTSLLPGGLRVPDVRGRTLTTATRLLAEAGFDPNQVKVQRGFFPDRPANVVVAQSPRPGAIADQGEVVLTVNRVGPGVTSSTTPEPTSSTGAGTTTSTSTTSTSTTTTTTTTTTLPLAGP